MSGPIRRGYTIEFKQEAVRLVEGGQSLSSAARSLGVSFQTVDNWVKAAAAGRLRESVTKPVNADQMEIARLKSELARARMERDILKKRRRISRKSRCEIRLYRAAQKRLAHRGAMPCAGGQRQRLPAIPDAAEHA